MISKLDPHELLFNKYSLNNCFKRETSSSFVPTNAQAPLRDLKECQEHYTTNSHKGNDDNALWKSLRIDIWLNNNRVNTIKC